MGICLDTDANTSQEEEPGTEWKARNQRPSMTSVDGVGMITQNTGKIKFDPPKVPVIFVLGGPGSGKVTHCDTLMQEKRGVIHINMMDLLQQYAMGNDMQDFSQLSSKTVTEVLMLEMKMAPAAKAYLISGYPRSMRDVVEYSEKIQVVNGVILISWRQSILQKQIDYGAKLGHVVLSLAKMELDNFFKNVMPVADYFDQSDMLIAVNGERAPTEVYKDFQTAALDILSTLENHEAVLNGISGMGKGINDIPGSIVSVDTAPSQEKNITEITNQPPQRMPNQLEHQAQIATITGTSGIMMGNNIGRHEGPIDQFKINSNNSLMMEEQSSQTTTASNWVNNEIPPCIWVIGGPGSNKGTLCLKAVGLNPGWAHLSIGRLLRQITDSAPRANTESYAVKESLAAGEMAPEKAIQNLLDTNLRQLSDKTGIIIDGFPRCLQQAKQFETMYKQRPPIILLDCSKLQLGRGRIDDTVSSFRRRLELFREQTLPMLKSMDTNNRLIIVDGDTDSPSVQREFEKIIRSHIQRLTGSSGGGGAGSSVNYIQNPATIQHMSVINNISDTILEDLEDNVPGVVPTISHHVSLANGHLRNNSSNNIIQQQPTSTNLNNNGGISGMSNLNGHIPNGQIHFRQMLQETDKNSNQISNYI